MKIKFLKSVSLALVLVALIVSVVQADTTWAFKFPTNVGNVGTSALTYYPVNLGYGTANLIASGKMAASGLDTNMQIASDSIPYMLADDKVLACIPTLPSQGINEVDLYTGYTPNQTSTQIVLGDGGYITTADNAALELGNNFSVELSGYVDTTIGSDLVYKPAAFKMATDNAGNVTAGILTAGSIIGTYTNSAYYSLGGGGEIRCGIKPSSFSGIVTLAQVYLCKVGSPTGTAYLTVRRVSDDSLIGTLGSIDVSTLEASLTLHEFNTTPVNAWSAVDTRIMVEYSGGSVAGGNYVKVGKSNSLYSYNTTYYSIASGYTDVNNLEPFIRVTYAGVAKSVTSSILSGEHTVKAYADATDFKLDIDSVNQDTTALSGASVPNNANSWVFSPISYWNYYSQTVGGVEKLKYQPNAIILGTVMPDRVNSYNGVITWGTNTDIELSYGEPVSYQSTSSATDSSGLGYSNPNATLPSTWFAFGENASQLPFYDSFNNVSQQTGQPVQTMYFIGLLGVALGLFIILVTMARSVMVGCAGFLIVLFVGSSMTIVPMWIPFVCLLVMVGILFLYRQLAY